MLGNLDSKPIDTSKGGSTKYMIVWNILFDGITPFLCNLCEISVDCQFNFHVIIAQKICFQQLKASVLADIPATVEEEFYHASKLHSIVVKPYDHFLYFMVLHTKIIGNILSTSQPNNYKLCLT